MSALPSCESSRLAGRLALLVFHWAGHAGHTGAERILALAALRLRGLQVATRSSVVLGTAFSSQARPLGDGQLFAATNRENRAFFLSHRKL